MKIQARAILVIVSTNFMIILLSILAGTGYVRNNIENYIEMDMMVVADIADRFISSELDLLRYEAAAAAADISAAEPADWAGILAEASRRYHKFIGMSVMSRSAGTVASAGERPASLQALANKNIQKAFSGEKAFSSTFPEEGGIVFYLALPVSAGTEHILVLTLDGMYFSDLVSGYYVWKTGHIFIDDSEGYVIANIRPEWVQNRQNFILQAQTDPQYKPLASVIKKLAEGKRDIDYYSIDGISRICAYRPISGSPEGWCLGIVAPLSESPVKDVDRGLLLIAVISFLLNIAAAVITSNFIRKPFEELAALRETAEADSRAKSSFLAHMSHEMRTPLNAVIGLSELTLGAGPLSPEAESNLEKIYGAGSTMLNIVNDILDISKIKSGKFELYPAQYDTPSLINDTVTLNIVRIGEKPVVFKLHVDENLPATLYGDDLRVKLIFNNLLSNAFKYTNAGTVEWRVTFERDGDNVWLASSVRDTGVGIKPEDVQKLFSDYNQVDTRANRKVGGTGLGLAITKSLVEMMDGTITVESEYGKGSCFYVRLRQVLMSDAPIGREVAENLMEMHYTLSKRARNTQLLRINMPYAHVLIVDDIETNLDVVKGMLRPYGMNIDCALSGQEAVDMIRLGKPCYSAVFMDHMMPGMDGVEATRIIREEIGTDYARNVPIIALTANAIVGNEEMFLSRGFQDFIPKPIDVIKLDSVLRRWVRDRELEKKLPDNGAESDAPDEANGVLPLKGITIGGVDKNRALERFGGDENIFIDVLRSFAANTPRLLDTLREYLDDGNFTDYAIVVHGIKGASYGILAREAGKSAEALEFASKEGRYDTVKAEHADFERAMAALLDEINNALEKIDAVLSKPEAAAPDPALLDELREACKYFDMDRVDKAMERLESFRYESGGNLVAWLREQINKMTFEEISGGEWPSK